MPLDALNEDDLMKAAFLALSLLGHPTVPITDRVPSLNIEPLCRDGFVRAQAAGKCMRDEASRNSLVRSGRLFPDRRVKLA
jgi:hypothetical protein